MPYQICTVFAKQETVIAEQATIASALQFVRENSSNHNPDACIIIKNPDGTTYMPTQSDLKYLLTGKRKKPMGRTRWH
jgi:ABC-type enterochelin transport system substrate-binding protein